MQTGYLIDTGMLLQKGDEDFESYANAYDKKYGYYDEEQWYALNKAGALKGVREYVETGLEGTYGVVSEVLLANDITQEDIDEGRVGIDGHDYRMEDVVKGYAKLDGKVVELFQ